MIVHNTHAAEIWLFTTPMPLGLREQIPEQTLLCVHRHMSSSTLPNIKLIPAATQEDIIAHVSLNLLCKQQRMQEQLKISA